MKAVEAVDEVFQVQGNLPLEHAVHQGRHRRESNHRQRQDQRMDPEEEPLQLGGTCRRGGADRSDKVAATDAPSRPRVPARYEGLTGDKSQVNEDGRGHGVGDDVGDAKDPCPRETDGDAQVGGHQEEVQEGRGPGESWKGAVEEDDLRKDRQVGATGGEGVSSPPPCCVTTPGSSRWKGWRGRRENILRHRGGDGSTAKRAEETSLEAPEGRGRTDARGSDGLRVGDADEADLAEYPKEKGHPKQGVKDVFVIEASGVVDAPKCHRIGYQEVKDVPGVERGASSGDEQEQEGATLGWLGKTKEHHSRSWRLSSSSLMEAMAMVKMTTQRVSQRVARDPSMQLASVSAQSFLIRGAPRQVRTGGRRRRTPPERSEAEFARLRG